MSVSIDVDVCAIDGAVLSWHAKVHWYWAFAGLGSKMSANVEKKIPIARFGL